MGVGATVGTGVEVGGIGVGGNEVAVGTTDCAAVVAGAELDATAEAAAGLTVGPAGATVGSATATVSRVGSAPLSSVEAEHAEASSSMATTSRKRFDRFLVTSPVSPLITTLSLGRHP